MHIQGKFLWKLCKEYMYGKALFKVKLQHINFFKLIYSSLHAFESANTKAKAVRRTLRTGVGEEVLYRKEEQEGNYMLIKKTWKQSI